MPALALTGSVESMYPYSQQALTWHFPAQTGTENKRNLPWAIIRVPTKQPFSQVSPTEELLPVGQRAPSASERQMMLQKTLDSLNSGF